jgi:hypothetical protein
MVYKTKTKKPKVVFCKRDNLFFREAKFKTLNLILFMGKVRIHGILVTQNT